MIFRSAGEGYVIPNNDHNSGTPNKWIWAINWYSIFLFSSSVKRRLRKIPPLPLWDHIWESQGKL